MYSKLLEIVLAALIAVGAWFYSGHVHVENYKDAQKIEQAEADKAQQKKYDELAASYEALRDKRESNAKVIVREVEKVVAGDVVYRNVCINDVGLSVINSALSGTDKPVPNDTVQATE